MQAGSSLQAFAELYVYASCGMQCLLDNGEDNNPQLHTGQIWHDVYRVCASTCCFCAILSRHTIML